jgi:LytS/YehU family sensor histidine kinase
MQALRAQMNPHFIFNCLSSINRFILKNEPDAASDYLTRFSRLIRMVLMNSQKSLITLEDELDMLTIYLDMERLRFKNTFDYHIVFTNRVDAGAVYIPPLLFQPFCENAIWHGLKHLSDPQSGRKEQGKLDIELSMDNKVLNCSITDNGIGRQKAAETRSKSAEENKSMGLKITTERLALLNGENGINTSYEIDDIKDENGKVAGTSVKLKISLVEPAEETA